MDASLFATINGLAGHNYTVDWFFEAMSRYGPFVLAALLLVLWFWPAARQQRDRLQWGVILATLSAALSLGLNQITVRWIWDRPRPFMSHAATLLLPPSRDPSFPSDHAAFAFAIAFAVLLVSRRVGLPAVLFAALLAVSRVYTGEHYVSDVAAGALVGGVIALLLHLSRPYLMRVVEPPLRVARRVHLA